MEVGIALIAGQGDASCQPHVAVLYHADLLLGYLQATMTNDMKCLRCAVQVVGVLLAFYVVLHVLSYLALARLYRQRR